MKGGLSPYCRLTPAGRVLAAESDYGSGSGNYGSGSVCGLACLCATHALRSTPHIWALLPREGCQPTLFRSGNQPDC